MLDNSKKGQEGLIHHPKWQEGKIWDDECLVSESSSMAASYRLDIGVETNMSNEAFYLEIIENDEVNSLIDEPSPSP